jgi:hypothetical protein
VLAAGVDLELRARRHLQRGLPLADAGSDHDAPLVVVVRQIVQVGIQRDDHVLPHLNAQVGDLLRARDEPGALRLDPLDADGADRAGVRERQLKAVNDVVDAEVARFERKGEVHQLLAAPAAEEVELRDLPLLAVRAGHALSSIAVARRSVPVLQDSHPLAVN